MEFYIITEEIKEQYQGFQKQNFVINFTKTNKGIWVINKGCGEDIFTEIDWNSLNIIELEKKDFIPTYETHPLVNGYRIISVLDLYDETIDINLLNTITLYEQTINKPYINGTWTDDDVAYYVNQLN
jgi:hypothetical protein